MQNIPVDGITLHYTAEEQESVALIQRACEKSILLLGGSYGLGVPKDCHVYIMTSWSGFIFNAAPWSWKVILTLTLPLWAMRARRLWPLAGGWEQSFGQKRTVGVKPPRLIEQADKSVGDLIFIRGVDAQETVQRISCHELTHAFSSHLKLPVWLKEGLAMVMVDRFAEEPTVRNNTLSALERPPEKLQSGREQVRGISGEKSLVNLYARGYWQTRYLDETQPELLKTLLSRPYSQVALDNLIATAYGKSVEGFWGEMHDAILSHFEQGRGS